MRKIYSFLGVISLAFSIFCGVADGSRIYLGCPMNYFGFMGYSDKWELLSDDGIVYAGTFTVPAEKFDFYICDYESDSDYTIFGSTAREGGRVQIQFTEEDGIYTAEMTYGGQGDWAYNDWPGGDATFSIDFGATPPKIKVTTTVNPNTGEEPGPDSGISAIGSDNESSAVFTLQGNKIRKADVTSGIYIINGKKIISSW